MNTITLNAIDVNDKFIITKQRLLNLNNIDLDDSFEEEDIKQPSDYAYNNSLILLEKLYEHLNKNFPLGFSILESRGGIYLIWRNQNLDKEVKIKIPANQEIESYVYYYQNDESELITITDINDNLSLKYLVSLLFWVSNNQPIESLLNNCEKVI